MWADFLDVIADLKRAGFAFDPAWFGAQREFRFPILGEAARGDVHFTLRQALEPWHVLGEESVSGATSRTVNSSSERVEIAAEGLNPARHVLACNGRRVPLTPTEQRDLHVAAVRFKARTQPRGLHPTLPVNAPLTFDLIDTWANQSLGGFVYHMTDPADVPIVRGRSIAAKRRQAGERALSMSAAR